MARSFKPGENICLELTAAERQLLLDNVLLLDDDDELAQAIRDTPPKGWTIQGRRTREKPEPRYLSVDAEGKVALVAVLGDGAYWKLTRKGDRMTSFDATLQASGGKLDGWYLGFSDVAEQIEKGRFKYNAYQPKLSREAGPRMKLHIFIDGP